MKPTKLPRDWIVVTSHTHPDRVYYFNVRTNKSSWEVPAGEPDNAESSKRETKGTKRKKNNPDGNDEEYRPVTPDLEVPKKVKVDERAVLKAKRRVSSVEDRDPRLQHGPASGSKDTPQMQQLREKMLERQAKGNAVKKSKAPQVTPPRPVPKVAMTPEKPAVTSVEKLETQNLTPQMRVLLEKMKERKAKCGTPKSPARRDPRIREESIVETPTSPATRDPRIRKESTAETPMSPPTRALGDPRIREESTAVTPKSPASRDPRIREESTIVTPKSSARRDPRIREEPTSEPLRRPRTRSLTPADVPPPPASPSIIRTRRSSRSIAPASGLISPSQKCKDIPEENVLPDNLCSPRPTVVISRLSPKAVRAAASPRQAETPTSGSKETSSTPEKAKTPRLGRSAIRKKNLAEERLANLQRSFTESAADGPSSASCGKPAEGSADALRHEVSAIFSNGSASPPSIYKNADARAKFLRERMNNKSLYEKRMAKGINVEGIMNDEVDAEMSVASGADTSDLFYEEMEWEPIEDEEIVEEIQVVRSHIASSDEPTIDKMPQNSLDLPDGPLATPDLRSLYIVVDTNVFLSNLGAVEEARDAVFKIYGRPLIVVPWTVFRELDFIKDDKSMSRPETLRAKARRAVRFLHQHFSAKHPRMLGQTPMDVANNKSRFEVDCPDDEILQTCLQIRMSNNCVVLLSYDKNLCNKAMIHDVATLGRDDPLEKIDYLHASEAQNESLLARHLLGTEQEQQTVPIFVRELGQAKEIFADAEEILLSFMTVVVTKEMQNLYNENWERYTIITPPWTSAQAVLKCAIKHWIAAVSESFNRRIEPLLRQLLEAVQKVPESGRKLSDVSHILECMSEVVQSLKVEKYSNIMSHSSRSIEDLKKKCLEAKKKLQEERFRDAVGFETPEDDEATRADRAFQQFEEVYAFARDMCGLSSEAIGMPCSFPYRKITPLPTIEDIKEMQPDVAANLNRLLQVLSTALEELNGLYVDHRAVIALYNALATFKPDGKGQLPREFSPLDVYCCLKMKHKVLKSGLGQLQELSSHFCRMATFRCT